MTPAWRAIDDLHDRNRYHEGKTGHHAKSLLCDAERLK